VLQSKPVPCVTTLTYLLTALCDILYKRLRNTLTYLLSLVDLAIGGAILQSPPSFSYTLSSNDDDNEHARGTVTYV